jgi:hypothetical protein
MAVVRGITRISKLEHLCEAPNGVGEGGGGGEGSGDGTE